MNFVVDIRQLLDEHGNPVN